MRLIQKKIKEKSNSINNDSNVAKLGGELEKQATEFKFQRISKIRQQIIKKMTQKCISRLQREGGGSFSYSLFFLLRVWTFSFLSNLYQSSVMFFSRTVIIIRHLYLPSIVIFKKLHLFFLMRRAAYYLFLKFIVVFYDLISGEEIRFKLIYIFYVQ